MHARGPIPVGHDHLEILARRWCGKWGPDFSHHMIPGILKIETGLTCPCIWNLICGWHYGLEQYWLCASTWREVIFQRGTGSHRDGVGVAFASGRGLAVAGRADLWAVPPIGTT